MSEPLTDSAAPPRRTWSPWRVVVGFGTISLAADMVYEGGRSLYGPLLSSLGASALAVGAITGAGEAVALLLRLASGALADRTRRYWAVTISGYALTAVCVPLLAVTPFLGAAGLAVAAVLILAERTGKAIRSPAKSALLAGAAQHVGLGRGSACTRPSTRSARSPARCSSPASSPWPERSCGPGSPCSRYPAPWPWCCSS